jgi:anti-anti-sigma regulatory factor
VELDFAPEVRRGDHACCFFASDDEQARLVGRFARDAFARGDRFFYLADRSSEESVLTLIDEAGLDARSRRRAGDLLVVHSSQMGFEGAFDAERQLAAWTTLVLQARADGYGGLAATAEMTWVKSWGLEDDTVVDYEAMVEVAFADRHLAGLCQYDCRDFDRELLDRVRHVHPVATALHKDCYSVEFDRMRLECEGWDALKIGGEIDLASVGFLEVQLAAHLHAHDAVGDLSEIEFIDVAGCRLLRRAALGELGSGRLRLRNTAPAVSRVMNICDWADGVA